MFRNLLLAAAFALTPTLSLAQQVPPIVGDRAKMMLNLCTSMGGRAGNADRPFTHQIDLTGDGKVEWLLDSAGFGCVGKPNLFRSPTGATLEVFTPNAKGVYASAYIGTVFTYRVTSAKPALLFITLKGSACGNANATCEKQLSWNAATRKFTAGPAKLVTVTAAPNTSAAPTGAGASPFTGPAFTVTEADKTAAFRAAGFKKVGSQWKSACDDPGTTSYTPGQTEVQDLNGDGRPEIWITEGGTYCYGNTGQHFWLMAKDASGKWVTMLDSTGIQVVQKGKRYGWPDIQVGGPGMGPFPTYRFDGGKYVFSR
jgi:hypothetical protein